MEQPANSPENTRPDGAEPASGAESGALASEHKEEERLDSEALIDAAFRGELARVKEILEGMKTNGVDINHQNKDRYTALMRACSNGLTEVALELLKVDGIDVNIQTSDGVTALMLACINGLTGVVLKLLKVDGLDVNVQNSYERTALMIACYKGHADIARRCCETVESTDTSNIATKETL
jgi:ankyrin repeat protein